MNAASSLSRRMANTYKQIVDALREREMLEDIQEIAARHHVTMHEICSASRMGTISHARQAAWLHHRSIGHSYPQIGAIWGKDHTTVMHGVRAAKRRIVPLPKLELDTPAPPPKKRSKK